MGKNIWYFVETVDDVIDFPGHNTISLSPEASYKLHLKGVDYSILEDYYAEEEIFVSQDEYFFDQLAWFKKIDNFLRESIPEINKLNIEPAYCHYYRIKCFVDSVIILSRVFKKVVSELAPDKVVYVGEKEEKDFYHDFYAPFASQKKIIPGILRQVLSGQKILFEIQAANPSKAICHDGADNFFLSFLKRVIKTRGLEGFWEAFKYFEFSYRVKKEEKTLNILSLHAGCSAVDSLIKENLKSGGKVFLKNTASQIKLLNFPRTKKMLELDTPRMLEQKAVFGKKLNIVFENLIKELDLFSWIDAKSGIHASDIIYPYFKIFFSDTLATDISKAFILKDFLKNEKIDFVAARSGSEREAVSSLMATCSSSVSKICFQHSSGAFDGKREHITELGHFDYYFTMHDDAEKHMKSIKTSYTGDCKIFQDASHIEIVKKKWKKYHPAKGTVMYIPTKLFLGFRNYNGYLYPITWYFELQKAFVNLFSRRKDLNFIFKYAPGQDWSMNSIINYINDKKIANIKIISKPVAECAALAERVILDFPSTSLYEVAVCSRPVFCVYHELVEMRPDAKVLFGESLYPFNEIHSAIGAVNKFLDSNPDKFKVDITTSKRNTLNILKSLAQKL
ncbi:hypothetical protein OMAG_001726 [Candidatus Omnitrophus magneticus]|uniref:Uncharacterized protein n=1 Tax=Candidatus Omnitrophus magneticus TaxID=1609969 RepID=A0A0F0CSA9_9BACT|nr:hypothetical protein OMAG_001726 [Candidatus Omnitrophus magneticus]